MNLLRFSRLDLPVYAEDEVAWTTSDIQNAARLGLDSFVRRACLRYEGPGRDLKSILALGDCVLTNVCERMHIDKISYSYGLAPLSEGNRARLRARADPTTYDSSLSSYKDENISLIPAGYGLVAAVDVVANAEPLSHAQRERAVVHWNPCTIGIKVDGYWVTNDDLCRADQFVSDPIRVARGHSGIVLVDPEHRLSLTREPSS